MDKQETDYRAFLKETRDTVAGWIVDGDVKSKFALPLTDAQRLLEAYWEVVKIKDAKMDAAVMDAELVAEERMLNTLKNLMKVMKIDLADSPSYQTRLHRSQEMYDERYKVELPEDPREWFDLKFSFTRAEEIQLTRDYILIAVVHDGYNWYISNRDRTRYIRQDLCRPKTITDQVWLGYVRNNAQYKGRIEEALQYVENNLCECHLLDKKAKKREDTSRITQDEINKLKEYRDKVNVQYPALKSFLADTADTVYNLISVYPEAAVVFKNHIDKIIAAAEKYGKFLRAECGRAKKGEIPEGKKYHRFGSEFGGIYFDSPDVVPTLYIKGKPPLDPLRYLFYVARGRISRKPDGITLLDYQCFLIACIYDWQRLGAGQPQIYFSPKSEDSAIWEEQLKDRICHRVWDNLLKRKKTSGEIEMIENTIETALQDIQAKAEGEADEPGGEVVIPAEVHITKGNIWEFDFGGGKAFVDGRFKGLVLIEHLLLHPNKEYTAQELLRDSGQRPEQVVISPEFMKVIEDSDIPAIKEAISKLKNDMADAEDSLEKSRIKSKIEFIEGYLRKSINKEGKPRPLCDAERLSVTRNIKTVLDKILKQHTELHNHLHTFLKVGASCSYKPDKKIIWRIS